jgi:hypothetical protein
MLKTFLAVLILAFALPLSGCGPQDPNPPLSSSCHQDHNQLGATAYSGCD